MIPSFHPMSGEQSAQTRLQPGKGARLISNDLGDLLSGPKGGGGFSHPWKPSLVGRGLRLAKGLIFDYQGGKSFEPTLNGVRVGGEPGKPQPTLRLEAKDVNEAGESFACVEVEPDADGSLMADKVKIVHGKDPLYSGRPEVGRHPLALIVWQNGKPRLALPIAFFNLRYLRWKPPAGAGAVRHFFL